MSTPSSPASSDRASITREDAFANCRAHPAVGVDLARLLGLCASGAQCLVDARELSLLELVMDRLVIAGGAKPVEWIGAEAQAAEQAAFPAVLDRLRRAARALGAPAIDVTLRGPWADARALLRESGHICSSSMLI